MCAPCSAPFHLPPNRLRVASSFPSPSPHASARRPTVCCVHSRPSDSLPLRSAAVATLPSSESEPRMSQSTQQTTDQSDDGSVPSRTHGQTCRRARDDQGEEEQHVAQPCAHVSPAMRLYRHALEAILSMLQLTDLSRTLAVSREWAAAVRSMAPIHASIERDERRSRNLFRPLPPVASIVGSPLLRHLATISNTQAAGLLSTTRLSVSCRCTLPTCSRWGAL